MASVKLSTRALQTDEPAISRFMKLALENPGLVSLAAGFVDTETLPAAAVKAAFDDVFSAPRSALEALQYGTTQGHPPLREKILRHVLALDGLAPGESRLTADDVIVGTGSQQLLYLLGEVLLDPGDIVIAEAPSYFVFHGVLDSLGARVLQVPMDDAGMNVDALESLLADLERSGELPRVKLVYTVDYFQNPTGLSLGLERRTRMLDVVRRFSKTHTIHILEDAAYRELRYEGDDLPSIKKFDVDNRHVALAMTFSKPLAPGLKTGYAVLPRELMGPVLRFKGNHDFGSSHLNQTLLDRILERGDYARHVTGLRASYRVKRDAMLAALRAEFPTTSGATWTEPKGGLFVWLRLPPTIETGPESAFLKAALREGVLYIPGEFGYAKGPDAPRNEMRLSYGIASPEQIREGIARLARAARSVGLPRVSLPRLAGCRA